MIKKKVNMKAIKVTYNGKRLKDIYPHATKWQVFKYKVKRFFRNLFRLVIGLAILSAMFYMGKTAYPEHVYSEVQVIKEVQAEVTIPPVMQRVAKCESVSGHFSKGKVTILNNKNGSKDIGKFQLNNKTWENEAKKLGYDIYTEKGNTDMAMYIYNNFGTEDWKYSKKCWLR